jgi:hypothetical protein
VGCTRSVGCTVTGVVMIDGRPAPEGVRVEFLPQVEKSSSSTGYTDAQGRYVMRFNAVLEGVQPGESIVKLAVVPVFTGSGPPSIPEQLRDLRLPEAASTKSTLRRTVKPGRNTINIDVETKSNEVSGK